MKLGICSDIHLHRHDQTEDIRALIAHINETAPPDAFICAGDLSHNAHEIEAFFGSIDLPCPKAWVPGNHDIWVVEPERAGDSAEDRYFRHLPELSARMGWHYLPSGPLLLPDLSVALVGSMGWFTDEGWSEWYEQDADHRDKALAHAFALKLEEELLGLPATHRAVVVTHHVPHAACLPEGDPRDGEVSEWMSETLIRRQQRIALVVHGHKHRRYGPKVADGVTFMAHPFGYPHHHSRPEDGYRVVEVPT